MSCVWVGLDGDEFVTAHLFNHVKLRNVRRDDRVSFSMEASGTNPIELKHYLVVHGRARIQEGGAPELLRTLAKRYLGPNSDFP